MHPASARTPAAYDLAKDQLYGHVKKTKNRSKFLESCRCLRSLNPMDVRLAIVCDNYFPHLTTKRCRRAATWAAANNVEIACSVPSRPGSLRHGRRLIPTSTVSTDERCPARTRQTT
ncbi:hypothetical protein OOK13_33190 [Streptomyces sp. NBC_00378]|nr:hypothetical protein [Streptomyces sp. NBC_00378]